ncbi:MAG TPA: coiled-coil domain-containing protein [Hyphomicrobiaceae bacterium]|jgi:F0F1-type ATP synthase membrane subunit b/b'|nr:coiled-coil domain-containing protein [Hyphomicrobiaceae bacterium]
MNARFDTLEYATAMEAAGIPRPHAEAIAKGLGDVVDKELVTRDYLRSELAALRSEIKFELAALRSEVQSEIARWKSEFQSELAALRSEMRSELAASRSASASELAVVKSELRDEIRKEFGRLELQIRALQFGGAIAAFALGAVVLLTRLI